MGKDIVVELAEDVVAKTDRNAIKTTLELASAVREFRPMEADVLQKEAIHRASLTNTKGVPDHEEEWIRTQNGLRRQYAF